MRSLLAGSILAAAASMVQGCSATTAGTVAQGAAVACEFGLPLAGEGGLAPICATIPEIEAVIAAWVNEAKASPGVAPKKHTTVDLYNAIVALRAKGGAS